MSTIERFHRNSATFNLTTEKTARRSCESSSARSAGITPCFSACLCRHCSTATLSACSTVRFSFALQHQQSLKSAQRLQAKFAPIPKGPRRPRRLIADSRPPACRVRRISQRSRSDPSDCGPPTNLEQNSSCARCKKEDLPASCSAASCCRFARSSAAISSACFNRRSTSAGSLTCRFCRNCLRATEKRWRGVRASSTYFEINPLHGVSLITAFRFETASEPCTARSRFRYELIVAERSWEVIFACCTRKRT